MSKPGNTISLTGKGWMPINSVYVQFPGKALPGTMFTGTWADISSNFSGKFFRVEGTAGSYSAAAFGASQASSNVLHDHVVSVADSSFPHEHDPVPRSTSTSGAHTHTMSDTYQNASEECDSTNEEQVGEETDVDILRTTVSCQRILDPDSLPPIYGDDTAEYNHAHSFSVLHFTFGHGHTSSNLQSSGSNFTPINHTIKIWKRTS